MKRSDFIKSASMAVGTPFLGTYSGFGKSLIDEGVPFQLDYAPHQGMFKASAGTDFLDEIRYMHDLGFRSIEDNGMYNRSKEEQEKIGKLLAKLDMRMGVFVVDKGGNGVNTLAVDKQEHLDIFLKGCHESVEIAKRVNAEWVTVVPGDFQRNLPMGVQTGNVIEALRRGAEIFEPHGIVMVLEALSDTPDLFLRTTDQAYAICKGVGSPSCKILYDTYHMQKNEGDLINTIERCWDEIVYVQAGDNPGRLEPTTGEINYHNLFKWLHRKGYDGVIGMEHGMSESGKKGEQKLVEAYREVDDF